MKANNCSESEDFAGNYHSNLEFPTAGQREKSIHKRSVSDQPSNPFAIKLQIQPSDLPANSAISTEIRTKEQCCEKDTTLAHSPRIDKGPNSDTPISRNPMDEENICLQSSRVESSCGRISGIIDRKAVECSLVSIEKCENAIIMRCKGLNDSCERFAEEQTMQLSHLKKETQNTVYRGLLESKGKIMDWGNSKMSPIGCVFTSSSATDYRNLSLFRFEELETEISFSELVGVQWQSSVGAKGHFGTKDALCREGEIAKNPLFFPDVNSFVAACSSEIDLSKPEETFEYQIAYFQSITEMLQAKEESYQETIQQMTLEQAMETWVQFGITIFRNKVKNRIPEMHIEDLSKRISVTFLNQQVSFEMMTRNAELKAMIANLAGAKGLKSSQMIFATKRRRGRPPKRNFSSDKDYDVLRKRQRSTVYIVVEGAMGSIESREEATHTQGVDGEEVRERSEEDDGMAKWEAEMGLNREE